jgi:predicted DCC family thiol-disulfide oxidoreductase YuxK
VYDFIARHRHRLMPGAEQCYLPSPAVRQRFLDQLS